MNTGKLDPVDVAIVNYARGMVSAIKGLMEDSNLKSLARELDDLYCLLGQTLEVNGHVLIEDVTCVETSEKKMHNA